MSAAAQTFVNAMEYAALDRAQLLITSGELDINAPLPMNNQMPPLVAAVWFGHTEIVELLLKSGAHIDGADSIGRTACRMALNAKRDDLLALLLAHEPKPDLTLQDMFARTLLDSAVVGRRERAALLLIEAGAALDNLGTLCRTAAFSTAVLEALVRRGIVVGALRDAEQRTPLHFCVVGDAAFSAALMRALVHTHAVDMSARGPHGNSCCHIAAFGGRQQHVRWLAEAGADCDATNDDGRTPLHMSTMSDDAQCTLVLGAAGAHADARDVGGHTASHLIAAPSYRGVSGDVVMAIVHALMAAGANLDLPDASGVSARQMLTDRGLCVEPDEIDRARRQIVKLRLDFVRARAFQVCIGLQSRGLDALQTCEILLHACGPLALLIPFHQWWAIATTVKHFKQ